MITKVEEIQPEILVNDLFIWESEIGERAAVWVKEIRREYGEPVVTIGIGENRMRTMPVAVFRSGIRVYDAEANKFVHGFPKRRGPSLTASQFLAEGISIYEAKVSHDAAISPSVPQGWNLAKAVGSGTSDDPNACTCPRDLLMSSGCRCGQMARERTGGS